MAGVLEHMAGVFFENHEFPNPNDPQQQILCEFFHLGLDPVDCGCPTPDVLAWNQQPLLFLASSGN